tara:strand:- start:1022 stop:1912 length:891 start_codon:yes stop_codon:yes gene_type:complete
VNIHLENVTPNSNSGPNSFGRKLVKCMSKVGHTFDINQKGDVILAFIQASDEQYPIPLVQRLDGIYFNTSQNYKVQNYFIEETYKKADGVIFQSNFNRDLTFQFFGPHENYTIIHNGADIEEIALANTIQLPDKFSEMWCSASAWRPHKRLDDNIKYFLGHAPDDACFVIAGRTENRINHPKIFYIGEINQNQLYSLYKSSTHFVHLAWLDHCPNVVVDARACGCRIVCSSSGGTREIAGSDAIVVEEEEWDFEPINLYQPPEMNFTRKVKNNRNIEYNMNIVAEKYEKFLQGFIK